VRQQKSSVPASSPDGHLAPPAERPRIVYSRDDTTGAAKSQVKPARIMIAEDDYLVASEMEGALRDAGFEVVGIAASAKEVLELASVQRPLLVVMDIRLSGQRDGVDAAIDLFSLHGVRCVFATAHHAADTRLRAKPANPLAWVAKPYTMKALIKVVRKAVQDVRAGNDT
jgi:two-component system, response regulator PdtaR